MKGFDAALTGLSIFNRYWNTMGTLALERLAFPRPEKLLLSREIPQK